MVIERQHKCVFFAFVLLAAACTATQDAGSARTASMPPTAATSPLRVPPTPHITTATPTATPLPPIAANDYTPDFDGQSALDHAAVQLGFGPRPVGSPAARATANYIFEQLRGHGWQTEIQEFEHLGLTVRNLIGRNAIGNGPVIVLGAHYDTRFEADRDPQSPGAPVPGANDGASGVAVLLELARALDVERLQNEVWLAFFDAEDNGGQYGWDWIVGSSYMAANLTVTPQAVIILDMIGDADQQIFLDRSSDGDLSARIWSVAAGLGYGDYFVAELKYSMLDDHTPFARLGIPAVDIIDFDYPYWHTTEDTLDKISAESLEHVGRTLEYLLENQMAGS